MRWALLPLALASIAPAAALTPLTGFDVARYHGTWYEIAAVPGFFQNKCARDTQVEYAAADYGALIVRNSCTQAEGGTFAGEGRARPLDPEQPAVLKVTFVYQLGIWWYPFGRNQIVFGSAPDYGWLVIGEPSLHYGRILARQPTLPGEALRAAANALAAEGYDLCAFMAKPHAGGRPQAARLCDELR